MSASPLFHNLGAEVLAAIEAGCSIADAATKAGCSPRTVERWAARGRHNPQGPYAPFARSFDAAREAQAFPPAAGLPVDEDELRLVVSRAVRKGSVPAMRLYWEMLQQKKRPGRRDGFEALDQGDELARRRKARDA